MSRSGASGHRAGVRRAGLRQACAILVFTLAGAAAAGESEPAAPGQPPEGRDPFRPPPSAGPAARPSGLAGLRIVEVVVRGILRAASGEGSAAILESPEGEGQVAKPGAELFDGVLLRIEDDGAVFLTKHDPPSEFFRPLAEESGSAGVSTGARGREPP